MPQCHALSNSSYLSFDFTYPCQLPEGEGWGEGDPHYFVYAMSDNEKTLGFPCNSDESRLGRMLIVMMAAFRPDLQPAVARHQTNRISYFCQDEIPSCR